MTPPVGAKGAVSHVRAAPLLAWEHYARARGYAFVPATGAARDPGPQLQGAVAELSFTIDLTADAHHRLTRVVARALEPLDAELHLTDRGPLARALRRLGLGGAATGDARFDARYALEATPRAVAPQILHDAARAALAPFVGRGVILSYRRGVAMFLWRDLELDPRWLDAGRDVIAAVCAPQRAMRVYR